MKSVTNNSLLVAIITFLKVSNCVQLFPLVGVPNELFDKYSQETFTCLDGSKTISKWDINDDYCDCPDGSDEPGTSACDFTFFCENRGYKSAKILSSRVNDGICDPECCDGSDEYDGKILCKDVCEQVAKNETKALKEKQKIVDQGLKVKNNYISHFKTWKLETEAKIKEIQSKFDELDKKANELKAIKEEKEKLEEELNKQDEATRQKNRINELDDKVTALEGIIEEQKKNIEHLLDVLKDLKENHNQNYHDMAVKGAITSYDEFNGSYKPVDVWTDPRLHPTTTTDSSSQATATGDDSEASKIRQGSYFSNFIKEQINSVQKFIDRVFSSQFPIDASSARSDYWNLDTERNDAKRELDDLNTKLNRDMGPDGEYSALSDKCFELDNGEYVYSVCMFGEANQKSNKNHDSVSLGHFSEWIGTDYSAQLYSNGTPCWNGPSRSVKLNLICGTEEKVTSVTEPSKCEYHISMLTPAACKPLGVSKPDVYDEESEL